MPARLSHLARLIAALGTLAALALPGSAAATSKGLPTLYVQYTTACVFTITDDSGKPVTSIPAGTYQVLVTTPGPFGAIDLSGVSDVTACRGYVQFSLTGPGVSITTTLDEGDAASALLSGSFQANATYTAVDKNQPAVAKVSFTTTAATTGSSSGPSTTTTTSSGGSSGAGSTTTTVPAGTPAAGALVAGVSASGAATLLYNRTPVNSLVAGRYTFTITDRSAKAGFSIQQSGKPAKALTSAAFVGKKTVTLTLAKGSWTFSGAATGGKTVFTVS